MLRRLSGPILLVLSTLFAPLLDRPAHSQSSADSSLLEHYVDTPDDNYSYELEKTIEGDGYTASVIRMTSQKWLSEAEVEQPIWWHWLTIVRPDEVKTETAFFYISGGDNEDESPEQVDPLILPPALESGAVTAVINMIPNQPLTFVGDDQEGRKEDSLIAYGWDKFLRGGASDKDAIWLARLPMTKAVVRGMDTVIDFSASKEGGGIKVENFVVAGGSKRGWTTWTTAIVDERVTAIIPIVIDLLNVRPSFEHHWQAYGFWAPAVWDYKSQGIMEWQRTREYERLLELVDPFEHRERLTLPKLILNASGDQFFLPDSWQFYWDDLEGEKNLRYVPNSEHSMGGTDVTDTVYSFFHHIVTDTPRPEFDWGVDKKSFHIRLDEKHMPSSVKLWSASNPKSRDFRVDTIRRTWTAKDITKEGRTDYRVKIKPPKDGFSGYFVELEFEGPNDRPLKLSTGIKILPEALPFGPFVTEDVPSASGQ